jgi:hypothetical protein
MVISSILSTTRREASIMTADAYPLMSLYRGWDDRQISLVRAIAPLSREHLAWRHAPHPGLAGEIASHNIAGRVQWFHRVSGAGNAEHVSWVAGRELSLVVDNYLFCLRRRTGPLSWGLMR